MRVLVTGGAGFIGSHLIEHLLKNTDWEIVSLDRLDTSGNLNRLTNISVWEVEQRRVRIVHHDLKAELNSLLAAQMGPIDIILHLAAASHVDRSITDPMSFILDNVVGTANLLNYARTLDGLQTFLHFSTDEIFGPCLTGAFKEWDRYKSSNPYSASKAGAEELCVAYENTYHLPIIISHCMNVFGERQHPEKYIPLAIRKILQGESLGIYANADHSILGSRFYLHARNVADAALFLLAHGVVGEKYNIVGSQEMDNLALAQLLASILNLPLRHHFVDWATVRPGHDLRYAVDGEKMAAMGWKPPVDFIASLARTTQWFRRYPAWL